MAMPTKRPSLAMVMLLRFIRYLLTLCTFVLAAVGLFAVVRYSLNFNKSSSWSCRYFIAFLLLKGTVVSPLRMSWIIFGFDCATFPTIACSVIPKESDATVSLSQSLMKAQILQCVPPSQPAGFLDAKLSGKFWPNFALTC